MALGRVFDFGLYSVPKNQSRYVIWLSSGWWMQSIHTWPMMSHWLVQEAYGKALIQNFFDRAPQALETLERDVELLKRYIAEPFQAC